MGREIKFRAWNPTTRTMLDWSQLMGSAKHVLFASDRFEWMQFTGLVDKNNVPIFEGDILKWATGLMSGTVSVKYSPACFYLDGYPFEENTLANPAWARNWCEVIGNIHQNSDLLPTA